MDGHFVTPVIYSILLDANKLLIGLENSWDWSFETKTTSAKAKTAKFRSHDQDCGLEDYISAVHHDRLTCIGLVTNEFIGLRG